MKREHGDQLRHLVPNLAPALQEPALVLAQAWEDAFDDHQALSLAYARLFLGPFEILASPYASTWLDPEQRLMGEVSQQVAQAYTAAGLAPGSPGDAPREVPDHVALEWEFMYFLTYQFITTGEQRWIEQRNRFFLSHVVHWMPSLALAIEQSAQHAFYDVLAGFLKVALEEIETS
jgi:TorA maturation chaperone TorD